MPRPTFVLWCVHRPCHRCRARCSYRSHAHALYASVRSKTGDGGWDGPYLTSIPNDDTNINAGVLPDGRVYLVSNPLCGYLS